MDNLYNNDNKDGLHRAFTILLAETNPFLVEKIADILSQYETIRQVMPVSAKEDLISETANLHPDFILVDMAILKSAQTVAELRAASPSSKIVAMTDSVSEPYFQASERLGLDGITEKSRVCQYISDEIRELQRKPEI